MAVFTSYYGNLPYICNEYALWFMKQNVQIVVRYEYYGFILIMPSRIDKCQKEQQIGKIAMQMQHFPGKYKKGVDGNGWYQYNIVAPFKSPILNSRYFVRLVQNTNEHRNGAISSSFETFATFVFISVKIVSSVYRINIAFDIYAKHDRTENFNLNYI